MKEIQKILNETGIPSVSVALIQDDSVLFSKAYGYANVKKKVPASTSTIYSTGSNFKFVTATAIMQLADGGKLALDDPINNYLGEDSIDDLSEEGKPVTFRHLLSHHSGLKGATEITPIWEKKLPLSLEEIAANVKADKAPGKTFEYCNHCYALAGLLIEKISGQSFEEYIVEHILQPLDVITDGPVVPTPWMVEEMALPYSNANNQSTPDFQYHFDVYPAGDIYLTAEDMAHFYIAQLNQGKFHEQRILSAKSIEEMHKSQFESHYGLGVGVSETDTAKYLMHTGGTPGFSTFFKAETKSKSAVYIASNAGNVHDALGAIVELSLQLIRGDKEYNEIPSFAKKGFEEIELSEYVLSKYIGKYQLTPEFFITITQEGEHLYGQATGQAKFEMYPYDTFKFFLKATEAQVHFTIKKDEVIGLTLYQNGIMKGEKVE